MKTITVLGNLSGRNAGDAAILGNLLEDISNLRDDIRFLVPTTNTSFIKHHFGQYNVKPVGLMPWNLALKNFGLPLFLSMALTDMILITDNILFDRKFYNPVVNNLFSISLFAPYCKHRGIPIVFYNASIGPIDFPVGKTALQKVLDCSTLMILRDKKTKELLKTHNLRHPEVIINADCAINTTPPSQARLDEIIRKEGLFTNPNGTIGFNINAYIDNWSNDGTFTRKDFLKVIASTLDNLIKELDVDIMFVVTQVMDLKITKECMNYVKYPDRIKIISNVEYTYQEITGLLQKVGVHAGLRTHTLIFSAAVNTPMININSYPKSEGFMRTIQQENWMIDFDKLEPTKLTALIKSAWQQRDETRKNMASVVKKEKEKAKNSAMIVLELLESSK